MDPKEFSWKEDQQVTVTNPTAETYRFKVHNKEYALDAGKTAKMPGYMAWVYVYGLATQICQADKQFARWNEEGFRQEYYEKLVSGVDAIMEPVAIEEKSPIETLDDDIDSEEGAENPTNPDSAAVKPMKPKAATSGKLAKSA